MMELENIKNKFKMKKSVFIGALLFLILIGMPVLINCLMCFTDFLYSNFGWTLSPSGLHNKEWIEFWCNYLIGIIALFSAYLVWISGRKERERQRNTEKARFYEDSLKQEQEVLVHVCKAIDVSVLYKVINQMNIENLRDQKQMIQEARDNIFTAQTELELLTDIPFSFGNCTNKECVFWNIVKNVNETFYKIENNYIEILNTADDYISKVDMQINFNKQIWNYEKIIDEKKLESERFRSKLKLPNLNGEEYEICANGIYWLNQEIAKNSCEMESIREKLENPDVIRDNFVNKIKDLQDYIIHEKPNLICYGKRYIDFKKSKFDEILKNGSANFREVYSEES